MFTYLLNYRHSINGCDNQQSLWFKASSDDEAKVIAEDFIESEYEVDEGCFTIESLIAPNGEEIL